VTDAFVELYMDERNKNVKSNTLAGDSIKLQIITLQEIWIFYQYITNDFMKSPEIL